MAQTHCATHRPDKPYGQRPNSQPVVWGIRQLPPAQLSWYLFEQPAGWHDCFHEPVKATSPTPRRERFHRPGFDPLRSRNSKPGFGASRRVPANCPGPSDSSISIWVDCERPRSVPGQKSLRFLQAAQFGHRGAVPLHQILNLVSGKDVAPLANQAFPKEVGSQQFSLWQRARSHQSSRA